MLLRLGHAPARAFQPNRFHFNWRWFWDYGGGELAHWGVHMLDVARWGLKKGMPERYRLFFRFASKPVKLIVYVWFNDEDTLRKAGSKTDVYETFKRMLSRGTVPTDIDALLRDAGS